MKRLPAAIRALGAAVLVAGLLAPGAAGRADDTDLFSTNVAPNVLLVADNSGSMAHVVWHPAFDPDLPGGDASKGIIAWKCNEFSPDASGNWDYQSVSSNTSRTYCSTTRTLYDDSAVTGSTRWDERYLNWYFGLDSSIPAEAAILSEIANATDSTSACLGATTFYKYRRTRASALRNILSEVVCKVNLIGSVRFGLAQFREEGDPEGGFVVVPIDDMSSSQLTALDDAIDRIIPETWTPLGETLFQLYTYFMRRDSQRPAGRVSGTFPAYGYSTSTAGEGGEPTATPPPQPVQYHCQKNFIIIITDGEPTKDDFDSDGSPGVDVGFNNFGNLIGDAYTWGDEPEEQGDIICTGCETATYLDDIAWYMQQIDFDPVLTGQQTIDVYTVGFTTTTFANDLLRQTALVGNGQFYFSNNAEELAQNIIDAVTDIIQKSQAFTAATVPATRTADGGNFYTSFFIPSSKDPFWEGHIKNYTINAQGQILDKDDVCALNDPNPPNCVEGAFIPSAPPHWDAADEMPAPDSRNLSMGWLGTKLPLDSSQPLTATAFQVTYPPAVPYPGSVATDAEGLADEIVEYARGCLMGTGVASTPCTERQRSDGSPRTLGDVFHSNPVVVGPPNLLIGEPSYVAFATNTAHSQRDRMLIAGANDGFLHGFLAGVYSSLTGQYDRGDGSEVFGFMPWYPRTQFKYLPIDTGNRDYYYVDGSPVVSDAWFYPTATTAPLSDPLQKASSGSEWKTVLISGLRQGGPMYFALDISNPAITSGASAYPIHIWDFPVESSLVGFSAAGTYPYSAYMGETWGDPVVAKIKMTVPGDTSGGVYERWVAVVTGGYSTKGDPNSIDYDASNDASTSRAGRAILILDLKTGKVLAAQFYHHDDADPALGTAGGGNSEMRFALASTPAVIDSDFDGFADLIYVGDLGGNIWKWVLLNPGVDSVNPSENVTKYQSNWTFGKLFQAPSATIGAATYYKSLFFPPSLVYYGSQLWVVAGTGERASPTFTGGDPADDSENNRLYVFKDPNRYGLPNLDLDGDLVVDPVVLESHLTDLTTTEGCVSVSALGYFLVAREGEKFVTNVEIIANYVFTGSFTPSTATDPCDAGGSATLYAFKFYCGAGFFPSNSGADQRRLELGDGVPTSPRLSLGEENRLYMMTSENELKSPPPPPLPKPGSGIFYWRELTQ